MGTSWFHHLHNLEGSKSTLQELLCWARHADVGCCKEDGVADLVGRELHASSVGVALILVKCLPDFAFGVFVNLVESLNGNAKALLCGRRQLNVEG